MRTTALTGIGIAAVAALALSGCAAGDTAGEADGPVTITYTNFISNDGNEENLQKIVDAFEEVNPDVTVEVTTLPYADYGTALQTDLAAGTVRYDTYEGRWGEPAQLGRFLQAYALEKATLEARRRGHSVSERRLADGSVRLTVAVGGAA